jgi:hypothetical protein
MNKLNTSLRHVALVAALLALHPASAQTVAPAPRLSDGHPDLSGVWWTGGDLGSPGYQSSNKAAGTGPSGPKMPTFAELYKPEAAEHAKTLRDKNDPTLECKPTAFGTLNIRLFDVGAIGQIVATPGMVVFLQETYHGYQQIPTDGREHRPVPPSYRGDAVGHWEGDTFVVETTNFTDDTWMWAEGRVTFHSDQLKITERYTRPDANTLVIEAVVEDPAVLTGPWTVPKQTLALAPMDQLLPLICNSAETQALMNDAQQ